MNFADTKIIFWGTSEYAVPILKSLYKQGYNLVAVITQPDKKGGRKHKLIAPPVKVLAQELSIPVFQFEKIKNKAVYSELRILNADLFITASYGKILSKTHLSIPQKGTLNAHASLLPELRGAAPIQRAIMSGLKTTGVTIMQTDEGMDSGPILLQESIVIQDNDTASSLTEKLSVLGAKLMLEVIPDYLQGKIQLTIQNPSQVTYASKIEPVDMQIDWRKSVIEIERQVRALQVRPTAFSFLNGKRFKFHEVKIWDEDQIVAASGTIIDLISKEGLLIQAGKGILCAVKIQPESKGVISGDSLVNGRYVSLGDIFTWI